METISIEKLSELVMQKRKLKKLSQLDLQEKTGINRLLIGRIERSEFVPSISQLESLCMALDFSIQDIIDKDTAQNVFVAMRGQAETIQEEVGIEKLFSMMLTLKKQKVLRSRLHE